MSEHPYNIIDAKNGQTRIQQSVFPAWHNRRYSSTIDTILGGERKYGGFEALQNLVKRQEEDEMNRINNSNANTNFEENEKDLVNKTISIQQKNPDKTYDNSAFNKMYQRQRKDNSVSVITKKRRTVKFINE